MDKVVGVGGVYPLGNLTLSVGSSYPRIIHTVLKMTPLCQRLLRRYTPRNDRHCERKRSNLAGIAPLQRDE